MKEFLAIRHGILGTLSDGRTDHFVDQTFVGVQMKSNWRFDERLLVSNQSQFDNTG